MIPIKRLNNSLFSEKAFLLLVMIFSSFLLFFNLGDRNLGVDESWLAINVENILLHGYPRATITYNFLEPGFVPRHDSWFSYYTITASYLLFGITDFATRLPSALFGLMTIIIFYFFTKHYTKNVAIAQVSTLLLSTSYVFYIHARYARYFSTVMFLCILCAYAYLRILDRGKRFDHLLFTASQILLFYTQIQLWAYFSAGMALHFFLFSFDKKRVKPFLIDTALILIFALPWMTYWLLSRTLTQKVLSLSLFSFAFKIAVAFYYFFLIVFPLIFLLVLLFPNSRKAFISRRYSLVYCIILTTLVLISIIGWNPLPEVRKIVSITLPFALILAAEAFLFIMHRSKSLAAVLVLLFIFSNLLFIAAFYPLKYLGLEERIGYGGEHSAGFVERSLRFQPGLFQLLYEITHDYQSIHDSIFPLLDSLGLQDDRIVIQTDLDHNQLNYQAGKRGFLALFIPLNASAKADFYIANYDLSKRDLRLKYPEYASYAINDYEDTPWMDSTDPIYRRYKKDDKRIMLLLADPGRVAMVSP